MHRLFSSRERFLHNGTVSMFESPGFERTRRLGKHHRVVTKVVNPGAQQG